MCKYSTWACLVLPFLSVATASGPLLAVIDAAVTPSHHLCNEDGHAINITNIGSDNAVVQIEGTYQGHKGGTETFLLRPRASHTVTACTSYGGYVLTVGEEMFNSAVQIHAQDGTVADAWEVTVPQNSSWSPQIHRHDTAVEAAAPICTGSGDPPSSTPYCYSGGELGETVSVKVTSFASEKGTFDVTGSGIEKISCVNKAFTKSGQTLSADLSDCVHTIGISSLEYCSDQDLVVVNAKVGPVPAAVPLKKTPCPAVIVV